MAEVSFPRLQEALIFAALSHKMQEREGRYALPYMTHPIEVLISLRYTGGCIDEDLLCAAVLHDVVEESQADLEEISKSFGATVSSLVRELTREEPSAEKTRGLSKDDVWQMRAEMLLSEIAKMSSDAQQVKLADRLCNLREAFRTKRDKKLDRYLWQTQRILKLIPREVNVELWESISAEMAGHTGLGR